MFITIMRLYSHHVCYYHYHGVPQPGQLWPAWHAFSDMLVTDTVW